MPSLAVILDMVLTVSALGAVIGTLPLIDYLRTRRQRRRDRLK